MTKTLRINLIILLLLVYFNNCSAQYLGGTEDGLAIGILSTNCSPVAPPSLVNIAIGGIEDGVGIGFKLTNCTPSSTPSLINTSYGSTEDGFGIGTKLTSCTPTPTPVLINTSTGGIEDGFAIGKASCLVLPIKLISFYSSCSGSIISIKWETATELNNDFFTLQSSVDGVDWESIALIKGKGNSYQKQSYSYEYSEKYSGTLYFRLKQTDFDGKFTFSGIISQGYCSKNNTFLIYPNPSNSQSTLKISLISNTVYVIEIFDILGQLIYSNEFTNRIVFGSELAPGIYQIKVSCSDKTISDNVTKFIKIN